MAEANHEDLELTPQADKWIYRGAVGVAAGVVFGLVAGVAEVAVDLPESLQDVAVVAGRGTMILGGLVMGGALLKGLWDRNSQGESS